MIERHATNATQNVVPGFSAIGSMQEMEHRFFFNTYKRLQIEVERGEGVYLYDRTGKRYIDFFGGLAVNGLGYGHPAVLAAIESQIRKYIHLSNLFLQEPQIQLAERLVQITGYRRVFLSNSGTEATEGAMKLARKWAKGTNRTMLYGLSNAFHGRTLGALSLMDKNKYREDFGPFVPNIATLEFNNVEDLRKHINETTIGIVLEFIQGEGGIFCITPDFARTLNELREQYGFLIIGDCIQCGIGRTGRFFGFEHFDIRPDIVVFAKAIGGGLPLGGILGNDRVAEVFTPGVHGTTFGGNPVACAAGLAVLREVTENGLMQNAAKIGEILRAKAEVLRQDFPAIVREVRGFGCMMGIDLYIPGQPVVDELLRRGILVNCTHETVLRLLPPMTMEEQHIDVLMTELRSIFGRLRS